MKPHSHPFIVQIRNDIARAGTLKPTDRIAIACSGGPDSLAALLALTKLSNDECIGPVVSVLHYHHGMRGAEADEDAEFVRACATQLGVPTTIGYGNGSGWNEEQARNHRYAFLMDAAKEANATVIVTAHTATDQAMTALLRILRGTHIDGLAGIPARRLLCPGLDVSRPLLKRTRHEGIAYLNSQNQGFRHDPTNDNVSYPRNRLREFFSTLENEFNPNLTTALQTLSTSARIDSTYINTQVTQSIPFCKTDVPYLWLRQPLAQLDPALRNRLLIDILATATINSSTKNMEAALSIVNMNRATERLIHPELSACQLAGNITVEATESYFMVYPKAQRPTIMLTLNKPNPIPGLGQIHLVTAPQQQPEPVSHTGDRCDVHLTSPIEAFILRLTLPGDRLKCGKTVAEVCRAARIEKNHRQNIWVMIQADETRVTWIPQVPYGQQPLHGVQPTHQWIRTPYTNPALPE